MLVALFVGQPSRAKKFLGFPPILQRAAFRAPLLLPNAMRQRLDVLLLPGLHKDKLIANAASSITRPLRTSTDHLLFGKARAQGEEEHDRSKNKKNEAPPEIDVQPE